MRVIIAGSRNITDYILIKKAIVESGLKDDITEIISGGARGVDSLGEIYANEYDIPIKRFSVNWNKYGKRAGYVRNQEMAMYGDALIAIWDGKSKGTSHMIDIAEEMGLHVFILKI